MSWDEGTLGGLGSARLGKARFTGSTVRRLTGSAVHRFTGSAVRRFTGLAVHRLAGSQVPRLTGSPVGRFSGSMVRRAGSAGSSLRFEPGPREKCPSLPVRTRVRRFGHRFAGSPYYDIPKKSKQNTLLWVAAPREGNPPGKHIYFLNACLRKNVIAGFQTAFFIVLTCS